MINHGIISARCYTDTYMMLELRFKKTTCTLLRKTGSFWGHWGTDIATGVETIFIRN